MAIAQVVTALGLTLFTGQGQTPPPVSPAVAKELQRLQGVWQIEAQVDDGAKATTKELQNAMVCFGRDSFLFRRSDDLMQIGMIKLDTAKTPKTVDASIVRGPQKGEVMLGIYSLEGDTLKVCFQTAGQERPDDFNSKSGSGRLFLVGKRLVNKDDHPDLTGSYRSVSVEIDGSKHVALTNIERMGNAYLVTYRKGPAVSYIGIGLRKGNVFCMSWLSGGQIGVTLYEIESESRLVGQYTQLGGPGFISQEVLTRIQNNKE